MTILILIKGLGRGGAEQLLVSAAPYLDRSRFDYRVAYLLPWKDALVPLLESRDVPTQCLDGGKGFGWIGRLRAMVRATGAKVIHAHSPYPAAGARVGLRGVGHVYTEHNVWPRYRRTTYWGNLLTFPRNDHVFAVSEEVRRTIRYPGPLRALPVPPVETLHHGLDPASMPGPVRPKEIRDELGIPDGAPVIGTVGNLTPKKDHATLLRAAALVRRRLPESRFVIVGTGPLEGELRALAARLGVADAVAFAGFRGDAPRLMAGFDAFVLSSTFEGLPIAMLEAMVQGVPVVATRVGGVPEVVTAGRDGLVVEPGAPEALARAIGEVVTDPALAARLGEAARRRAAHFDIRRAVSRMEEVYAGLLR